MIVVAIVLMYLLYLCGVTDESDGVKKLSQKCVGLNFILDRHIFWI